MGKYDLTAAVDFIHSATHRKKMHYVGFSEGTTTFLVMASTRPEYNKYFYNAVLVAPVADMSHMKSQIVRGLMDLQVS